MTDSVRITNLPDSGSAARVAYDLWVVLKVADKRTEDQAFDKYVERRLALYTQCFNAANGYPVDTSALT